MNVTVQKGQIIEKSSVILLARVLATDGTPMQQASVSSIACRVFDVQQNTQSGNPTLTVAGTIFNSLQTDAKWTADSTGYNVAVPLDGTNFPAGNTVYRVEVKITPVGATAFYLLWDVQSTLIYSP